MAYTTNRVMIGRPLDAYLGSLSAEETEALETVKAANPDLVNDFWMYGGMYVFFGSWIGYQEVGPGVTAFDNVATGPTSEQESEARAFCDSLPAVLRDHEGLGAFGRWFIPQEY